MLGKCHLLCMSLWTLDSDLRLRSSPSPAALAHRNTLSRHRMSSAMVQVETLFWSSILNTVQSALISLQAYPYHATVAAIMDVLVSQESRSRQTAAGDAAGELPSGAAGLRQLSAATQPIVEAMPG